MYILLRQIFLTGPRGGFYGADIEIFCQFQTQLSADGYSCINCVSRPATIAAYTKCDYWIDGVNDYIEENIRLVNDILSDIPQMKIYDCQGTYLMWLDMRGLGMNDDELDLFLQNECGIIQDPGFWFGENGKGFTRLNVACPRSVLEKSVKALKNQVLKRV